MIGISVKSPTYALLLEKAISFRTSVEEHIPCHKRGVYGKERDNAG